MGKEDNSNGEAETISALNEIFEDVISDATDLVNILVEREDIPSFRACTDLFWHI